MAFKGIDIRQTSDRLVFRALLQDSSGDLLATGTTTLKLYELQSDGTLKSYDFNDDTFKTTALTTETLAMTHRQGNNATTNTGLWSAILTTLSGFTAGNLYFAMVNNTGASPKDQQREFQFGSAGGDLAVTSTGNLKVDVEEWQDANVPTPSAAGVPKVDVTHWKGTAAGAVHSAGYPAVTVKDGTGTGEINTSAGAVANVGTVGTCVSNTDMRGTDGAALAANYTAARAGYLDNLNVGGNVASSAEVVSLQLNTRIVAPMADTMERPDSGTIDYLLHLYLYDMTGNMEAPDETPTIAVANQAGSDRSSNLGTVTADGTGHYTVTYTLSVGDAIEQLNFQWSIVEGGQTIIVGRVTQVVDTTAVDFTAADRAKLDTLHDSRCTEARLAELDAGNLPADVDTLVAGVASALAQLGTAGAGLTDVGGMSTAMKAQIESEVNDALVALGLDHLFAVAVAGADVTDDSFAAKLTSGSGTADFDDYDNTSDSLPAISAGGGTETVLRTGTAQAGGSNTITLDAGAAATDDHYQNCPIAITGGTGAGQSAICETYNGTSKVAQVSSTWAVNPDNTSVFKIFPLGAIPGATAPSAGAVADAVCDELLAGHATPGSLGSELHLVNRAVVGKRLVDHADNSEVVYDDDGSTPLVTLTPAQDLDNNQTTVTPS